MADGYGAAIPPNPDFFGLFFAERERRQREALAQSELQARQQHHIYQGFTQAMELASKTGDARLATDFLGLATQNAYSPEMERVVGGIAKRSKEQAALAAAT